MNNENAKKDTKEPELVTKIEGVEPLAEADLEKVVGGGVLHVRSQNVEAKDAVKE